MSSAKLEKSRLQIQMPKELGQKLVRDKIISKEALRMTIFQDDKMILARLTPIQLEAVTTLLRDLGAIIEKPKDAQAVIKVSNPN